MKELVVISGKGGTGKTSLVASFAALAHSAVLADCDVDAADLHLVLHPETRHTEPFSGGKRAWIDPSQCSTCGECKSVCRFEAVLVDPPATPSGLPVYRIDPIACEGCGVCAWFCPEGAIQLDDAINGEWFISDTRHGPMVHAKLGIAEENSGKLVSTVRQEARKLAEAQQRDLILIDGSPGIGCPVIASITGANLILIVTEPTVSGLHDLKRVAELARHFAVPAMVAINKWDLNPEVAEAIEAQATESGLRIAGRIRYDRGVTQAQIARLAVVEFQENGCAGDIRSVWQAVQDELHQLSGAPRNEGKAT
ncbi:MAG TPA: ATP-binding protein [Candidatus Hydrogenedentes bacterium]|jgi:MinD superfamily P-loop ATPase|nr:ATP-binding protein [Candidatus Hydrogenedentota bacterium]